MMGIEQKVETKSLIETLSIVEETSDSTTLLSVSYKRLAIENISPTLDFFIDTESKEDQEGIEYLLALTNKPFYILINIYGEIIKISGLKEIKEEILSEIDSSDQAFSQYENTLNTFFEAEQIRNNLAQMSPPFPEKKLQVNDNWKYVSNSGIAQFNFVVSNTSKVVEISDNKVVVQIDAKISTPEEVSLKLEGINAAVSMCGNEVSEINIDPQSGITTKGIKKQNILAEMKMDMSELGMDKIEVPMTISTSMNVSVVFK